MNIKPLGTAELCFYKLLLLKSEAFEGKTINLDYLEKQTSINWYFLIEPLKNLLANKIITLKNEELSYNYIFAYKEKRKEFERQMAQKSVVSIISGGGHYDYKDTKVWKSYFTDEYCKLDKDTFDKLSKDKKIKLKINEQIFDMGSEVRPIYYFNFNLTIDKEKLGKILNDYLDDFIGNKFNTGDKYAYLKQMEDIGLAIVKLTKAGYPKESLLIDGAQIFPKNKQEVRPTDGQQITAILLYDFVGTVLAMEKQGFLKVLEIQYQKTINKVVTHSGLVWEDPIKIKVGLTNDFDDLFFKYTSPEEYRKINQERAVKVESKKAKVVDKIYQDEIIDLTKRSPIIPMKDLFKEADRANQAMQDQAHQERLQRQQFKNDRILATKEDKYLHAINTIIERAELTYPERKSITIDYYYFNFEDRSDDLMLLEAFLKKLQQAQCFEKFERHSSMMTRISFTEINLKKLKEYRDNNYKKVDVDTLSKSNNEDSITYTYKKNEGRGILKIGKYPEIEFMKIPALIMDYFYNSYKLNDAEHKSYKDFNATYSYDNISSSKFSKTIIQINGRIKAETSDFIKEIIQLKSKQKTTELNRYKLAIKT